MYVISPSCGDDQVPLKLKDIDPETRYTLREVAEMLDLSYQTVLKLRQEDTIKATRLGGRRYYVLGEDILKFVGAERRVN